VINEQGDNHRVFESMGLSDNPSSTIDSCNKICIHKFLYLSLYFTKIINQMEIFKDFKEGYQVSNLSNIKNPKGEVLKLRVDKAGYKSFKVKNNHYFAHRVALEVFNPVENMENKWVKRFDKNILNNNITNLYWLDKPISIPKKESTRESTKPIEYIPFKDEIFLPIENFEDLYLISNYGNIIQKETKLKLYSYYNTTENYMQTNLYNGKSYKTVSNARIILKCFKPNIFSKNLTVFYKDNNPKNLFVSNLEWISYAPKVKNTEEDLLEGEIFKTCFEMTNYEVSNKGRLRHVYNKKIRSLKYNVDGYKCCTFNINGKTPSLGIHRLILMAFDPRENMKELYVNHINHIRDDNRLENLEWVTPKENQYHSNLSSNYRNTRTVGIKVNGNNKYSINLNLGSVNNYEEAQKILFEACEKLNIDTKYFIRKED
jgi:hypothetical protein